MKMKSLEICCFVLLLLIGQQSAAQNMFVTSQKKSGSFTLSTSGKSTTLYASNSDFSGVQRALKNLKADITLVTGAEPQLITDQKPTEREVVIVGTLGKSILIRA